MIVCHTLCGQHEEALLVLVSNRDEHGAVLLGAAVAAVPVHVHHQRQRGGIRRHEGGRHVEAVLPGRLYIVVQDDVSFRGIIILFVQVSQGHENSRKSNFCLKKCINPLHVMSLVWNEPWLI